MSTKWVKKTWLFVLLVVVYAIATVFQLYHGGNWNRDIHDDFPEPSEYLLGGNIGERNDELLKSVEASDIFMNRELAYRGKCRNHYDH